MAEIQTVRARERHGARSLDLTVPTRIIDEFNVNGGDVFAVSVNKAGGKLTITYRRVYAKEEDSIPVSP